MIRLVDIVLARVVTKIQSVYGVILVGKIAHPEPDIQCVNLIAETGIKQRITAEFLVMLVAKVALGPPFHFHSRAQVLREMQVSAQVVLPVRGLGLVAIRNAC